jgi:RNA polymerase sigma-70 factor (ECF subfamily)
MPVSGTKELEADPTMAPAQSFGETGLAAADCALPLTIDQVHATHADFVWACLQRFGLAESDAADAAQEVFLVVHRQLGSFRGEAKVTTWLYGICLRVASSFRRRLRRRAERVLEDSLPDLDQADPEEALTLRERERVLAAVLDELTLERRALIVMYEIDELSCDEIASIVGVPVGTVYSRLHAARHDFERAVKRFRARRAGARW